MSIGNKGHWPKAVKFSSIKKDARVCCECHKAIIARGYFMILSPRPGEYLCAACERKKNAEQDTCIKQPTQAPSTPTPYTPLVIKPYTPGTSSGSRTEIITDLAKAKSSDRQAAVLEAISDIEKSGGRVTFYTVEQRTGASKSFLYGNETIRSAIEAARERTKANNAPNTLKKIISSQRKRIAELEDENKALRASYAQILEKYEEARNEINLLKEEAEHFSTQE